MEKTAAPRTKLSDDPSLWSKELISALLEQAGYLGQYRIDQRTLDQDEKRGYAYGFFAVTPQSAPDLRPSDTGPNTPLPSTGPGIRVPFIVEKRKLKPLLTFINPANGLAYPLTQRRVDAVLYSPSAFDISQTQAGVGTGTLSGSGMFPDTPGEGVVKTASLCGLVGQTISPSRKEKIAEFISSDPTLLHGLKENPHFREKVEHFLSTKSKEASAIKATVRNNLPTDAVLVERTPDGYKFASACTRAYFDQVDELTGELQAALPEALRKEADAKGYAVRIRNLNVAPEEVNPPQKIKTSGAYMVQTSSTHSQPALVFTHVRDLDGKPQDGLFIKTASGHSYVQEAYGTPTDNLPAKLTEMVWTELPRGRGCFVKEGSAGAIASPPVNIRFYEESDGKYAHYDSGMTSGKIRVTTGVDPADGFVKLAAGLYAAHPETFVSFLPLGKKVKVATNEAVAVKLASANLRGSEVEISHSDGEYTLSGAPVQALGGKTSFVGEPQATFFLGLAGVPPVLGKTKLAEAQVFGRTTVRAPRIIETYEAQQELAKVAAVEAMPHFPEEDYSLLKVATALQEENTVDAVLGLNFITPENMAIFIDYLPFLEEASSKVCELLLASQLGVSDVPEDAAVRAINALEAITAGLELLKLKGREQVQAG